MPLPTGLGRYRKGKAAGELFVFAGRKFIPLATYKGARKFDLAKYGALQFTFQVPRFLKSAIPEGTGVSVKLLPMEIIDAERDTSGKFRNLKSIEAWADWARRAMNTTKENGSVATVFRDYAILNIDRTAEDTVAKLKTAFRENLTRIQTNRTVSIQRTARRRVFEALSGSAYSAEQIPGDVPYKASIFEDAIDGFKYERQDDASSNKISIGFKIPATLGMPHPDFGGGPSGFKGRDQIALSILGLKTKSGRRYSSNEKLMIVPVTRPKSIDVLYADGSVNWTKKSMAVIQNGKFVYPSKKEPNPSGIPVNFAIGINAGANYIQDPSNVGTNRTVFWGQVEKRLYFPGNVRDVLMQSGMMGVIS